MRLYSGTLSDFSFPFSRVTNRYLLSAKTRVSSFSFSVTVRRAFPTIPSNFAMFEGGPLEFVFLSCRVRA